MFNVLKPAPNWSNFTFDQPAILRGTNNDHILFSEFYDFIECFTTTFLRAHSWLHWIDDDDDEDEVGLKENNFMTVTSSDFELTTALSTVGHLSIYLTQIITDKNM